jgi:hypothetical protein
MGIVIIFLDEFKEYYGLVMDFWNDNFTFVTQKNEKVDLKKLSK